jgi:hypothetical protein
MLLALLLAAPFTHPSPQPPSELPVAIYQERREKVMRELGGCAAAIAAQGEPVGVVPQFRQDDDFFWLTGMNEPGAWLVLLPKAKYTRTALYLRPRDPEAERWTGPRDPISPALKEKYGVDLVRRGSGGPALLGAAAKIKGSPPFRRTTFLPSNAFFLSIRERSSWESEWLPLRLPA